jgi:phage repressor protein C with HTH and peptisase S24 domain
LNSQHQRDEVLYYIRDMRTLAERLIWAREQKGLSQEALAKLSGVSQSTIGNLEAGIRKTARKIVEIAAASEVDPIWLANGTGEPKPGVRAAPAASTPAVTDSPFVRRPTVRVGDEPDTIPIRRVQIKLRAGFTGFETVPEVEDGGVLHVPKSVIEREHLVPHQLLAVGVHGCSMEPLLFEGDSVVIDTKDTEPISRELYAVNFNSEACVKQLVLEGGQWYLRSMHHEHPAINLRSGQCEIIGRVVYMPGRVMKGRL